MRLDLWYSERFAEKQDSQGRKDYWNNHWTNTVGSDTISCLRWMLGSVTVTAVWLQCIIGTDTPPIIINKPEVPTIQSNGKSVHQSCYVSSDTYSKWSCCIKMKSQNHISAHKFQFLLPQNSMDGGLCLTLYLGGGNLFHCSGIVQ